MWQLVSLSEMSGKSEELWPEREGQNSFPLKRADKAPNPKDRSLCKQNKVLWEWAAGLCWSIHIAPSCTCSEFHFEGSHVPPFSLLSDRLQQRPSKTKECCSKLDLTLCVGRWPVSLLTSSNSLSTSASLHLFCTCCCFIILLGVLFYFLCFSQFCISGFFFFFLVFQTSVTCPLKMRWFSLGRMF